MTIVNTEHGHTVEFNQEKHVYIHNNEYIVGTSTILGKLASPMLENWKINNQVNALKDEMDKFKFNNDFNNMNKFKFNNSDIKAFNILGITVGLKWEKIQEKFKKLVKKFHPDMNSGNKKFEDKLKIITLAYTQLKNTYKDKIDAKY